MTTIHSYFRISDAKEELAELYKPPQGQERKNVIFLVPTTLDKDALTDIITDRETVFCERPQIMTIGELYKKLAQKCKEKLRLIDPPDHKLILKFLVENYKQKKGVENLPCGLMHKGFITLLSDNIHTLIKEGISPNRFISKIEDSIEENAPENILHDLYYDYCKYLKDNNLLDSIQTPDRILELLAQDSSELAGKTLAVVGFSSFTGNQLNLFRKLLTLFDCEFFLPTAGINWQNFRGAQQQIRKKDPTTGKYLPKICYCNKNAQANIQLIEANNHNLEYATIARQLALWSTGEGNLHEAFGNFGGFGDIGILAAANSLDAVENELRRYNLPYYVVMRGTVAETEIGILPKQIWAAYSSGWDTTETAMLLADPLLSQNGFNQRTYLKLFLQGKKDWTESLIKYGDEKTAEIFEQLNKFCDEISKDNSVTQILQCWKTFLDSINPAHTAAELVKDYQQFDFTVKNIAHSMRELEKKIAILEDQQKSIGDAAKQTYSGAEAIAFILDWASTATLPIQLAQKNAIALYGKTPATFQQHKYWIMTDMDINSWPGKLRESPLLRKEQIELLNSSDENDIAQIDEFQQHIPTIKEQREQKEMLFRRLIATATDGTIVAVSKTDENGRPLAASPFISRLFDNDSNNKDEVEWKQSAAPIVSTLLNTLPQEADSWFTPGELPEKFETLPHGTFPRKAVYNPQELTISLSGLDAWLECPYLYWCRKISLEQWKADAYETKSAGNLTHRLWQNYWQQPEDKRGSITGYVLAHWEDEIKCTYPALSTPRLARYEQFLRQDALNLASLQDKIEKSAKDAGRLDVLTEVPIQYDNGNDFEIDGVKFKGRFDRVDLYQGNRVVILDYKLGNSDKHKNELQIAAYAYLLKEIRDYKIAGYGWLGHGDGKLYGYFASNMQNIYKVDKDLCKCLDEDKLTDNIQKAEDALKQMAAAVNEGTYAANYNATINNIENGDSRCKKCTYQTLCRRAENGHYFDEDDENDGE